MTRTQALSLADLVIKGSIPFTFALLGWQANRMVAKFDALEAAFNSSQVQVVARLGAQETKIVLVEQLLHLHIEQVQASSVREVGGK